MCAFQEASKERAIEKLRLLKWEKKHKSADKSGRKPAEDKLTEKHVVLITETEASVLDSRPPTRASHSPRPVSRQGTSRPDTSKQKTGRPSTSIRPGTAKGKGQPH